MDKLYIINFKNRDTSWYWANTEDDAKAQSRAEDEATEDELDKADIWIVDEAIHRAEIIDKINRYIIKPIKKA